MAHATALSWLRFACDGLTIACTAQALPFQRSARYRFTPPLVLDRPTAVHAVADGQDTAVSLPPAAPLGLGTDCADQVLPFHRAASGMRPADPPSNDPTAVQRLSDGHETAAKIAAAGRAVVDWTVQVLPFQRSASAATPVGTS